MGWRDFLKPTILKIVIFLLTMGGLNYLIISTTYVIDARILVGLPLGFWPVGSQKAWPNMPTPPSVEFSWTNFIVDAIFWYLFSCIVVFFYEKVKLLFKKS